MIELILSFLQKNQSILSAIFYISALCIFSFILQKIKNLAREATEKTIKNYEQTIKLSADETIKKTEASLRLDTEKNLEQHKREIELLFRDEDIRKNILQNTIIDANKK
ncbi:hypothetical protein EHQ31_09345 [Leptospira montravelensis]|uniref:Uncharacterized protein n=1 Tax=Leptospira montravelensis TaxID=2484961 RepID=A0ABY2LQN8_9LEPT|nr:hypothetical protein [Leptospira montravelensis]TGK78668.1 hypothetical protein EHQ19_16395 [Leptospira montravelensis]TGL02372.1 hypothetical protein EHQ31_09345 [Leptospira montravelensis]